MTGTRDHTQNRVKESPAGERAVGGWAHGEWRAAVIVAVVAGLAYANAIANHFTLDDDTVIANNDLVRHLSSVWRAFALPYWPVVTPAGQYRPLAIASFAVDWAVSGGSPHWMHFVNVMWHVLACVLVWRLLRDLVTSGPALAGALFFALHPVHVEAVANTVGRCEIMAAVFVVGAVLAHRRGSWMAVPLYAAALASKESGAVFLGLAAANDLLLGTAQSVSRDVARTPAVVRGVALWRRRWPLYTGYFGVAAVYAATLAIVFRHRSLVDIAPTWFRASAVDRWLTEARVVPEYLRLMFAPYTLRMEYSPRVIDVAHHLSPLVAAGMVVTAAVVVALVYAWRRAPVAAFGLAWFGIAVSPVSNVLFASGVVLAERTLYLPSAGAAILAGWAVQEAVRRLDARPAGRPAGHRLPTGFRGLAVGGALAMLMAFAVRTWTRTAIWHDDKRLLVDAMLTESESYRTHLWAAEILGKHGDMAGAQREYVMARTLYPEDPHVYEAAAMIADAQDQFALADRLYDSASAIVPGVAVVYLRQARLRFRAGDYAGAIRSARMAYQASPDSVAALNVLTGAAQHIGDFADAEWAFRRGLSDHPGNANLHQQYSWMLAAKGDTAGSRREATAASAASVASAVAAVSAALAAPTPGAAVSAPGARTVGNAGRSSSVGTGSTIRGGTGKDLPR
ncbi:MAG: tetratricopeptide repeat protein [Gemmatimonadales bacterium]